MYSTVQELSGSWRAEQCSLLNTCPVPSNILVGRIMDRHWLPHTGYSIDGRSFHSLVGGQNLLSSSFVIAGDGWKRIFRTVFI